MISGVFSSCVYMDGRHDRGKGMGSDREEDSVMDTVVKGVKSMIGYED